MNATVEKEYKRLRKSGERASQAIYAARIIAEWEELDGVAVFEGDPYDDSQDSRVRILIRVDDDPSTAMDFDCGILGCEQDCRIHKAEARRIERNGVVGIEGQYRSSLEADWVHADSVYGFVGDDWKDSGYDVDVMSQTLEALTHFSGC